MAGAVTDRKPGHRITLPRPPVQLQLVVSGDKRDIPTRRLPIGFMRGMASLERVPASR